MNTQRKNSLLLLLCAFIWGTAFVAQSAGSGMGACSFLAGRSWLGGAGAPPHAELAGGAGATAHGQGV